MHRLYNNMTAYAWDISEKMSLLHCTIICNLPESIGKNSSYTQMYGNIMLLKVTLKKSTGIVLGLSQNGLICHIVILLFLGVLVHKWCSIQ